LCGVAHRIGPIEDEPQSRQVALLGLSDQDGEKLRNVWIEKAAVFLDPARASLTAIRIATLALLPSCFCSCHLPALCLLIRRLPPLA